MSAAISFLETAGYEDRNICQGANLLSSRYSDFIVATNYDSLPNEVTWEAKKRILDLIGVALAGSTQEFPQIVLSYVEELGGKPEASVINAKGKFPAPNAALANGVCGHALEMDDGHRYAAFHPGACIVPSALAAAEMCGASTKDIITGVVAGYEVSIRIARAMNPSHLNRGFHTTGTIGAFGAAIAAGKVMRLGTQEMISALGIAGLQGAGLLEVVHDGAMVKPINPGKAAMNGLLSAVLAKRRASGPRAIFEGKDGFLRAMADETRESLLTDGLGEVFEICNAYTKFYASCRHTHSAIDGVLEICRENEMPADRISRISVETYGVGLHLCGSVTHPTTISAARFSLPFTIALAISKRDVSADKFTAENINDKKIQQLAGMVELSLNEEWEKLYPDKRGATVHILTSDGKTYTTGVALAKGEPENPATLDDLYSKFHANASRVLSGEDADTLCNTLMNLENVSIESITKLIARRGKKR